MTVTARRHPLWVAAVAVCSLVVLGLFAEVSRRTWTELSGEIGQARSERAGVRYLHPAVTLVGELVAAQSAAVAGKPVDTAAVGNALKAVAVVDDEIGAQLGVRQRFADLRVQVEATLAAPPPAGRPAYLTYTDLVALSVDLLHRAGGNSELVHQEQLDAYYLMDAVMFRLPDAVVLSGRAADLVALAGNQQLQGDDSIRAAVARFGVATAGEEVTAGLNRSVDTTSRTELGSNIATRLDAFRSAVDAFAPPTMVAQLAGSVDAAELARGAQAVYEAALPLAHRLLSELNQLLGSWEEGLVAERTFVGVAAGGALVAVVVLLLLVVRRRRTAEPAGHGGGSGGEEIVLTDVRRYFDADELAAAGARASARPVPPAGPEAASRAAVRRTTRERGNAG
jgi:hypothetical protein